MIGGYALFDTITFHVDLHDMAHREFARRIADTIAVQVDDMICLKRYEEASELFNVFCQIQRECEDAENGKSKTS